MPELRGFEKFCEGRPARDAADHLAICGVCPSAHHMAATKALDALFGVTPPPAARAVRELFYHLFMFEDHLLHFFFLGGPDFIVGPDAARASGTFSASLTKWVIGTRKRSSRSGSGAARSWPRSAGKPIHPVLGLPGGVAKQVSDELRQLCKSSRRRRLPSPGSPCRLSTIIVLRNRRYLELILSDVYYLRTNYMGMVDAENRVNFYDGSIRIVSPEGAEVLRFKAQDYHSVIAERVEPWTYIKFPYIRKLGWKGFVDGAESGIFRVAPIARLNAADGMATPLAQAEYERLYTTIGGKPIHNTLAIHWARLIETLYAAERLVELANAPELTSPEIRNLDFKTPREGVGIVEAPRGTLIHHYKSDPNGMITGVNLVVATVNNSAAINMSIERAAKKLIRGGVCNDGLLNMVEMAFRAYDPCLSCATHALPGKMALEIRLKDRTMETVKTIVRDNDGRELMY